MTFVTAEPTFNLTKNFTTYYPIVAEISAIQLVVQPMFSTERVLPLRCWYPFDQFVSITLKMNREIHK